jgi:UPF0755 protein
LIIKALKNFENKFTLQMKEDLQATNLSLAQAITLASIIEKEVGRPSTTELDAEILREMQRERELVASVFLNRLKIGMPLQSDATVNYITGKGDRQAKSEDLKIDSPTTPTNTKGFLRDQYQQSGTRFSACCNLSPHLGLFIFPQQDER